MKSILKQLITIKIVPVLALVLLVVLVSSFVKGTARDLEPGPDYSADDTVTDSIVKKLEGTITLYVTEEKVDVEADITAIKEINNLYGLALKTGDLELLLSLHTDDVILMGPGKPSIIGKEKIRANMKRAFENFTYKSTGNIEEVQVSGDLAFSRGTYTISLTPKAGSGTINVIPDSKFLTICKRQPDGSWKIYRDCYSSNVPPAKNDRGKSTTQLKYEYRIPEEVDDEWETASLSDVGMAVDPVVEAMNNVINGDYGEVHSVLIVKDGKLVFEEYLSGQYEGGDFTEFNRDTMHDLASVTKSFTSTLIGIAINQDYIKDVNESAYAFFPEFDSLRTPDKDKITIKHLLTMTSGLEWDESIRPYSDKRNDLGQLFSQSDPIKYILSKSVETPPGERFLYNGGGTNLLGEIVRKATGLCVNEFAKSALFSPLGITDYRWYMFPHDVTYVSGGLKLRPRDMAKFGSLFLQKGVWRGKQIISAAWVEEATKSYISIPKARSYGYQWWIKEYKVGNTAFRSYVALGRGGQMIRVIPDANMVIVFTAGNYEKRADFDQMITDNILPACLAQSDEE
ncbi:MAG: SgcJ/EcaC family oxidoreductase [Planctomycetes bacterium]|nr:SgcJ/EcaC family oxidoreductase [Planctomycetota bacterium]